MTILIQIIQAFFRSLIAKGTLVLATGTQTVTINVPSPTGTNVWTSLQSSVGGCGGNSPDEVSASLEGNFLTVQAKINSPGAVLQWEIRP
jgi:hypothetical protein